MSQLLASEHAGDPDAGAGPDPREGLPPEVFGAERLGRLPRWAGVAGLLALGFVFHYPALTSHFLLDDYLHDSMLEGHFPGDRHPLDLYSFVDDRNRDELMERGLLPWWSDDDLTIRFFRPLSSALIVVDHALFGFSSPASHLHSLLWWVLAVLAARALYRRALGPRVAWIAAAIFGLAPCHALPLSWIANRDALLAVALGVVGLWVYVRAREARDVRLGLLAVLPISLSLLAGEYALSFLGYALAFELVRKDDSLATRALGVLPYAVPSVAYLAARRALGFGTAGSGFYCDPFRDPEVFFAFAPRRLGVNVLQGWLALDPDTLTWSYPTWLLALGLLGLGALVTLALRTAFLTMDEPARRTTSWLVVGSIVSLVPVLAVVPSPRLLGASTIGMAAAVAVILDAAWFRPAPSRRASRELLSTVALALAFFQLVRGPGQAWLQGRYHHGSADRYLAQATSVAELTPDRARADVVVLRGMGASYFIPFSLGAEGLPARNRILSQARHVLVRRVDERTVELFSPLDAAVYPWGEGNLFRDMRSVPAPGDVLEAAGMRATILRVEEGRVVGVRIELDAPLEDFLVLNETREAYVRATPPEVGFGAPFDHEPPPL